MYWGVTLIFNEIRDEFEKRKGKITKKEALEKEKQKAKDEEEALRGAKVKGAEFTSKKISGLEISQRESYLGIYWVYAINEISRIIWNFFIEYQIVVLMCLIFYYFFSS